MSTELTRKQTASTLPAPLRNELQSIKTSPGPYYVELRPEKVSDPRPDNTPTLSQIQKVNGFANALAVLTFAIHEVKEWFNVKNNLTHDQEAMTAELILDNEHLYDLSLGNIKACFRQKMMDTKLYDRLDGNIIIGWLREFKSDMADWCENRNLGRDRMERQDDTRDGAGAIAFETYMAMLESRANDGDKEAQKTLAEFRRRAAIKSAEQTRQDRLDFHKFKMQYLKERQLKEQQDQ